MINVAIENVSKPILKEVNAVLIELIDVFNDYRSNGDFFNLKDIFPSFLVTEHNDMCEECLVKLKDYSIDLYIHRLNPLQEQCLYGLIKWWIDTIEIELEKFIPTELIKTEEDNFIAKNINNLDAYFDFMFYDFDFTEGALANALQLSNGNLGLLKDVMDYDLINYYNLFPDDLKEKLLITPNQFENDYEKLIITNLNSSILLRSSDKYRLINMSETQLSDDIAMILKAILSQYKIEVHREAPNGMSKKTIGENDFLIDIYKDGVYQRLAVGENKEWGNFENQINQLLGYMDSDTLFGFTIIFNKTVSLKHVLDKRKEILENFKVSYSNLNSFKTLEVYEVDGLNNVLCSKHQNPENNSIFKLYHFIVNAKLDERRTAAINARAR